MSKWYGPRKNGKQMGNGQGSGGEVEQRVESMKSKRAAKGKEKADTSCTLREENRKLQAEASLLRTQLASERFVSGQVVEGLKGEMTQAKGRASEYRDRAKGLTKKVKRAAGKENQAVEKAVAKEKERASKINLKQGQAYTENMRELARVLVANGVGTQKVGETIQKCGEAFGIEVSGVMSCTNCRTGSSGMGSCCGPPDSIRMATPSTRTLHPTEHQRMTCQAVALQVPDYRAGDGSMSGGSGQWDSISQLTIQMPGASCKPSRTKLDGYSTLLNGSPLATRKGSWFERDDFIDKCDGSTSDHASDQVKKHNLLGEWKEEVKEKAAGGGADVRAKLAEMGRDSWEALTDKERLELDILVLREIGQEVMETLDEEELEELKRFIRTGCSMHKDLNTVRGGDTAL
ncbi:hypothetical protein BKA70DRAFT_1231496 [Coprinopsis sp. MPI-PUGE-AT-0042]|nr:hypothetical protein BKA70DRAFT_1231496 [Coprinopsis sp. MPI-PUGE-AT-0042]